MPSDDALGGGGGRMVFLAVVDCDDHAAIERLREILPEGALLSLSDADPALFPFAAAHEKAKDPGEFTARQRQILQFMGQGLSNKEIGRRLGISHFTVRNHVSRLLQQFKVASRRELRGVALATAH